MAEKKKIGEHIVVNNKGGVKSYPTAKDSLLDGLTLAEKQEALLKEAEEKLNNAISKEGRKGREQL